MKRYYSILFIALFSFCMSYAAIITPTNCVRQSNPYALRNMQAVYDTYDNNTTLLPTHLYVKFAPSDTLQYKRLIEDSNLELFDYPMDIILNDTDVYVETNLPSGVIAWLYATVQINYEFPLDVNVQIIDTCYIPLDDESIVVTKSGGSINVEDEAFIRLGYSIDDDPSTRSVARVRPHGIIQFDDGNGNAYPVKGIKIRCHNFVKWETTTTDSLGCYYFTKKYITNVHYSAIFDNIKGFEIWDNIGPFDHAKYNLGWHSKNGYDVTFYNNSKAWTWCVINDAACNYYEMCTAEGISLPPSELKILEMGWVNAASTPMLSKVYNNIGLDIDKQWFSIHANLVMNPDSVSFLNAIRYFLPDITIGTKSKDMETIFEFVFHELSHASHFSSVGSPYWSQYIKYIVDNWGYGDGTAPNHELCGIGEMWGYSMGYYYFYKHFEHLSRYCNNPKQGWINWQILDVLQRDLSLSKRDLFDLLTGETRTYEILCDFLVREKPDSRSLIRKLFYDGNLLGTDGNYLDYLITNSETIENSMVVFDGVEIDNNSDICVRVRDGFYVEKGFEVNIGSSVRVVSQ